MKAANLKAASSWSGRVIQRMTQVDVLLRTLLTFAALIVLVLLIEGWKSPFPYRLGDYCADGILARIDFERVNVYKTELARIEEESQTPPVYRHDRQKLRELGDSLRRQLLEIADVESYSQLTADTQAAFGIASLPTNASGRLSPQADSDWQALRSFLGPRESAEGRVDEVLAEFTSFLQPIADTGFLSIDEFPRRDLREDEQITVITQETGDGGRQVPVVDTLLKENLKPTGRLARNWKSFTVLEKLQPQLERWLLNRNPVTLVYDEVRSQEAIAEARDRTQPIKDSFKRGAVLVPPGTSLNLDAMAILHSQYDAAEAHIPWYERAVRALTVLALLAVLAVINGYYLVRSDPRVLQRMPRLVVYLVCVIGGVGLARLLSFDPWRAEVIPLLCVVMVLAIAYNQVLAALTGFSMTIVLTLSTGFDTGGFMVMLSSVAMAVVTLTQVSSRSKLIKVGFWSAVTYFLVTLGAGVMESQSLDRMWTDFNLLWQGLRGAGWCLAAGYLVAGSLPFLESTFGVVTDISLLELSDVSHPLLQELVRRAPGTYNHSIGVATIAETAADAIGANGLLCRVGAYFHDIGKMLKPAYFVENVPAGTGSKHEHLAPAMSTLVIIGHVKDGVDLAQQHNLPEALIDFIEQHHGTTLVEFFYHKATKQAGQQPDLRVEVQESAFRYPGPKPQSKEAGILMLADAVEGASRALSEPTPKRIETLVHDLMLKRLLDRQFDESGLNLNELAIVEESLVKSLIAIYHGRIKYPDQKSA